MKRLKYTTLLLLSIIFFNCGGDDDGDTSQNEITGQWRFTSGSLYNGADKFAYFNEDNTIDVLRETYDNFRGVFNTTFSINDSEITIDGLAQGGPLVFTYILEDNILALTNEFTSLTLQKVTYDVPSVSDWIEELTILEESTISYGDEVDIAFSYDKTQILYTNSDEDYIALINPTTFVEEGQIETIHTAYAVEVEKFDLPDRYIFQSDNGSDLFHAYYANSNNLDFTSIELGAWIRGLASVDNENIWVSSSNESALYLYDYINHTTDSTILIGVQPHGLDYQNNFLYICDGLFLHKCQTQPDFSVLETYSLPNSAISGVAFDGNNFWVSTYNYQEDTYKLIKTNLTL